MHTGYVDKMADSKGANWSGDRIILRDINERLLHVAVPRDATEVQSGVLATMARYADEQGVRLIEEVVR